MSISNTTRKTAIMLGNGVSVKFPFSFRINNESDLKVYVKTGVGAYTLKILNTDYKLSDLVYDTNNNIIAGNIEYPIIVEGEPDQPSPLTENDSIYGIRETPKTQEESSEQVSFKSKDMERALDKATMQIQELDETISRAITVPEYQDIEPSELINDIYTAAGQASQAAEDASGYANNASTYATNASTSATNASKWAEGTDSDVSPFGGTHSAKGWANQAANSATEANNAVASINRPLLSFKWFDHLINNQSWLRADTFSWQDGEVYSDAYNHLVDDIGYVRYMIPNDDIQEKFYRSPSDDTTMFAWTNQYSTLYTENEFPENGDDFYYHDQVFGTVLSTGAEAGSGAVTPTTETIAGTTITYYPATDGHKIVLADQETNVSTIYTATGVAWYYILDTTNTRFKLPRTRYGFVGLRDGVGEYVKESLPMPPDILVRTDNTSDTTYDSKYGNDGDAVTATSSTDEHMIRQSTLSDSAKSVDFEENSVYKTGATVQQRATQMYLYFYVDNFSQTATEQTAGLNSELFNGKVDLNLNNITSIDKVATALGPDTDAGVSLPSGTTLTQNGWIVCNYQDTSYGIAEFKIDGATFIKYKYNNESPNFIGTFFVSKGQTFTISTSGTCTVSATFYPVKGV